jgi:transcriptional regulator with XRE-family HTH domain
MTVEQGGLTIRQAMDRRGWTYYRLAQEAGVWASMVKNILAIEAEGDSARMGRVQMSTVLRLIDVLWPHVQLTDLLAGDDCAFQVVPRNEYQRRRLEGHVES